MTDPFDTDRQGTNFEHTPTGREPVSETPAESTLNGNDSGTRPDTTGYVARADGQAPVPEAVPEQSTLNENRYTAGYSSKAGDSPSWTNTGTGYSVPKTDSSSNTYYTQGSNTPYYSQGQDAYGSGYQQNNQTQYTQRGSAYNWDTNSTQNAQPQQSGNSANTYQENGGAYTWNTNSIQTTQQPYYQQPLKTEKKREKKPKGNRTALKVLGVFMCCLITSTCVLGLFVGLIQNGTIGIDSGESESSGNAAFTINKVIEDETSSANTTVGSGVSVLTKQEISEKLIPSVVCLQIYTNTVDSSSYYGFGNGGNTEDDTTSLEPTSQGSGIVYTEDGYIITNAHVISGASNIKVVVSDGTTYEAEVVGSDTVTDLAVVKIIDANGATFTPAEFGSSGDLKVADEVLAIGNPGGIALNSTVTMGYVSALDREVTDSETGYTMKCIQTDAAINPGNSGGALVNMYGQVVGINSSKIASTGYEGLGFAIPTDTAQPIISDLVNYGYVKDRAMLGISGTYIDSMTAQFYNLEAGMYVQQINTQEAEDAGLQIYDVITEIDGNSVTSSGSITSYLLEKMPGDTVELTVSRSASGIGSSSSAKETLTLHLVLTESSQSVETTTETESENSQSEESTGNWFGGQGGR